MKKNKIIANIIFALTLASPIFSFWLTSEIGESDIFGVAGIIRYSWVMWFFVPIGVLSILIGKKLKRENQNYKKNYIIAFICLPIIILFGSYRLIFSNVSYDINKVSEVEYVTNLDLPNQVKIATNELDSYNISYLKIVDEAEKRNFEQELETNTLWKKELNSNIKRILPLDIQYELENFDYFVFYNLTNDEYNLYPSAEKYGFIFISYDREWQRLIILDNSSIE